MRKATGNSRRNGRVHRALAVATVACLAIAASPASAGNEFEDGFEDQMGRLLAFEAFNVGKFILSGGHPGYGSYSFHAYPRHSRHRHHSHWGHHRHNAHRHHEHHGHHRSHRRYWRRHHGHDHDYRAPCSVETTHRVWRDRRGEVVEYERRERRRRDDDHHYVRW